MRCAVFSTKPYDEPFLSGEAEKAGHALEFLDVRLMPRTARLAEGFSAVCVFVNDELTRNVLETLAGGGTQLVALRCAGYNQVDLMAAKQLGIAVVRVPAYSPHAVAEHTLALILSLNRKIHKAYQRVRENNFALNGLLGFDIYGKTVGIVGTGAIGTCVATILRGFGCHVLMHDIRENETCRSLGTYVTLSRIWKDSDIISLHCPLTDQTFHLIDDIAIKQMKANVVLVNTSRGGLVDTRAVIVALKSSRLGALALDVYEEESELFFEDQSQRILQDDVFSRLLTFPNVLVTAHQAFFTQEAMAEIARVTMQNLTQFEQCVPLSNAVSCT